jgi:hypothetical protein
VSLGGGNTEIIIRRTDQNNYSPDDEIEIKPCVLIVFLTVYD